MPIRVRDRVSGEELDVSSAELQQDIVTRSGRFIVTDPDLVVTDGTETRRVAPDDYLKVAGRWRILDEDEASDFRLKKEAASASQQIVAAGEAVFAGASLGLSTAIERAAGVDMDLAQARREGLGGFGTALELGGALAPALFTGGAGGIAAAARTGAGAARIGTAARVAGAMPAGAATRVAVRAGEAAAGLVGPGVTRTIVGAGTRGAVEGFAFGAGAELDEQMLNSRFDPEAIAMAGGMGALLGAPAEVGSALLLNRFMKGSWAGDDVSTRDLADVLASSTGASKIDDAGNIVVDTAGANTAAKLLKSEWFQRKVAQLNPGVDEADVARTYNFLGDNPTFGVKALDDPKRMMDEIGEAALPRYEKLREARRTVVGAANGVAKRDDIMAKLPSDEASLRHTAVEQRKMFDGFTKKLADTINLVETGTANGNSPFLATILRNMSAGRRAFDPDASLGMPEARVRMVRSADLRANVAHGHEVADMALRDVRAARKAVAGMVSGFDTKATDEILAGLEGELKTHIVAQPLYGAAGKFQEDRNRLIAAVLRERERLAGTATGRALSTGLDPIDSRDIATALRESPTFRGKTATEAHDALLAAESDFFAFMRKESRHIGEAEAKQMDDALEAIRDVKRYQSDVHTRMRVIDTLEHWKRVESNSSVSTGLATSPGMAAMAGLGYAVGGIPGAVVGGALGMAFRPHALTRKLVRLNHAARQGRAPFARLLSGIKKAIVKGGGFGLQAARRSVPPAIFAFSGDRHQRTEDTIRRVVEMALDPVGTVERVQAMMRDFYDDAPRIADELVKTHLRAVNFLSNKTPVSYRTPRGKVMYDPIAMATYQRYVDGVEYPLWVFANILTGKATREHVEAVKAVYPSHWEMARETVMTALDEAEEIRLSLAERTSVAMFYDIPIDETLPLAPGIRRTFAYQPQNDPSNQPAAPRPGIARKTEMDMDVRRPSTSRIARGIQ